MIKVIIVDDHEMFRAGIRNFIESKNSDISFVGEAESSEELFALLPHVEANIVLLDIKMPGMSGIEIAGHLKRNYPEMKILIISSENTAENVQEALEAGIDGFISKNSGRSDKLAEAIRSIIFGEKFFGRDIAAIMYDIFVSKKGAAEPSSEFTDRERDIIQLSSYGLPVKQIADRLNISPRTVENNKMAIFRKLGINSTVEMVQYALKHKIIRLN